MSKLVYAIGYEVDGNLKILTENDSIFFAKYSNGKTNINPDLNKILYFSDEKSAIEKAASQGHEVDGHRLAMYTLDADKAPEYIDRNGGLL